MRIAILGLGRMGTALALRALETDHDVAVWNRSGGKADEVVAAGAKEYDDVEQAVKSADVVLTTLSTDEAVREVALGRSGIRSHIGDRLYIEASTISPDLSEELAAEFDNFVAMPIAGSPDAVREGKATYLVGGVDEAVKRAQPLIDALSASHHRYPTAPLANVAKLTANVLLLVGLVGLVEGITVGRAGGLSDEQLTELLETSPMLGPGLKNRLDAVMAADGPTWWTMALGVKDVKLALDLVSSSGERLPAIIAVRERYEAAVDLGLTEQDIATVARLYLQP